MTLIEGKNKVYKLLDEYGMGEGVDEELAARMNGFFDTAQKDVAKISKIIKTVELTGPGRHKMPADFLAVHRIWKDGRNVTRKCSWRGGELVLGAGESVELDYFALPAAIAEDTEDEYVFEVREDACEAMPFFVAGMVLASDLVQDGSIFFELYEKARMNINGILPGHGSRVCNTFYG